jgi:hypothetical protein
VLYLIGGPARSGKSLLARRLLRQLDAPYLSTDYLTSGLAVGAPALGVRHELPNRVRGERVWPVLAGMLRNIAEVEPAYVVEGDVLLPDKVAQFAAEHGGKVRACFLGYARCTVPSKCASIRSVPGPVNDWVAHLNEECLAELVAEMRAWSASLESECDRHGLPYFDGSADFEGALHHAVAYLLGEGAPRARATPIDTGARPPDNGVEPDE